MNDIKTIIKDDLSLLKKNVKKLLDNIEYIDINNDKSIDKLFLLHKSFENLNEISKDIYIDLFRNNVNLTIKQKKLLNDQDEINKNIQNLKKLIPFLFVFNF